jgi:hypothetical protein
LHSSGRRRGVRFTFGTGATNPAARRGRLLGRVVGRHVRRRHCTDGWRDDVERDPLTAAITLDFAIAADTRTIGARGAFRTVCDVRTRSTLDAFGARRLLDRRAILALGLTFGTLGSLRAILALGAVLTFGLTLGPVLALIAIIARLLLLAILPLGRALVTIALLLATRLFALLLLGLVLLRGLIAIVVAIIAFAVVVIIIVDVFTAGAALLVIFRAAFA